MIASHSETKYIIENHLHELSSLKKLLKRSGLLDFRSEYETLRKKGSYRVDTEQIRVPYNFEISLISYIAAKLCLGLVGACSGSSRKLSMLLKASSLFS